ncbi:DUF2249 domain-containing protein [Albibacterium bauzanense]|uniref:Uncharacterized protein DUF2249 n=1 Tax=Albibacterium bauzanense TaxID=653929 RepID=A0A4R1M0E6_9SPHI|nr:DUF2249 domain-containing protein [Albibacterium bauzanense]TCK84737.1 uncharacterized protein DUF2249 [Albibacterium bauzanense]
MDISENTRISDLLKENKVSIDAIASLAKPLEKLKNPILRKLMASRVTIAEAAKMGGCSLQDFERVLTPLGFKFIKNVEKEDFVEEESPNWLKNLPADHIEVFDVREILLGGQDPLKQIMQRFKSVPTGNALCIVNSFIPVPLVRLLEKDGVKSFTKTIRINEFHTYFYKVPTVKETVAPAPGTNDNIHMLDQASFQEEYNKFSEANIREIDVRALEMPGPMQTILQILPTLSTNEALYVNHKRVPLYLLEEIAGENYYVNILTLSEIDVKLLIYKR